MAYFILRDEKTGRVRKVGRYRDSGIGESLQFGEWRRDSFLYSEMFDGLLEQVSEAEAERLIALHFAPEKIAA